MNYIEEDVVTKFIELMSGREWINVAAVELITFSEDTDCWSFYGADGSLLGRTYRTYFTPRDFGSEVVLPASAGHTALVVGAFTDTGKVYVREEHVVGWRVTSSLNDEFLIGIPVLLDGPSDDDSVFVKCPDGWWYAVNDQSRYEHRDDAIEAGRQDALAHSIRHKELTEARAAKLAKADAEKVVRSRG